MQEPWPSNASFNSLQTARSGTVNPDRNYGSYYAVTNKPYKSGKIYLHRLIINPAPGLLVDHINGDGLDCRRSNMRVCTKSQNAMNSKAVGKSSHYKGVSKSHGGWIVRISIDKNRVTVGRFINEKDAALAYDIAAKKYYKEFANLNFTEC